MGERAGGSYSDIGKGITTLSDDSTVVTGRFNGEAVFGEGEPNETIIRGSENIFVARYNSNGTLAWAKSVSGSHWDEGYNITALSDDSTVVTGRFSRTVTFGEGEINETILTSAEGSDIFIARYNPDGTIAWAKRAGGGDINAGTGITSLSDDSTVITGYFNETAVFGEGEPNETELTVYGFASKNIYVARYNSDGTLAWAKKAGGSWYGTVYESGRGITTLLDDSVVVTGIYLVSAIFGEGEPNETVLSSAGLYDIFIARYNPDGTLVPIPKK